MGEDSYADAMRLEAISRTDTARQREARAAATDLLSRAAAVICRQRGVTEAEGLAMLAERAARGKRNRLVLAAEIVNTDSARMLVMSPSLHAIRSEGDTTSADGGGRVPTASEDRAGEVERAYGLAHCLTGHKRRERP